MSQAIVREVRERTEIVDLISQTIQLKRTGRTYKGLCPFHNEKTPSFVVFPDSQHYHCFGCQKNGDVFAFYMATQNATFGDALKELAARAGIDLPSRIPVAPEVDQHRQELFEINKFAASYFANFMRNAPGGQKARDYVAGRGLDEATLARFQIGAAPDAWDGLSIYLARKNADLALAHDAGLLQERDSGGYYDRFRDRLIFPIKDRDGNIAGFGGRSLGGQDPKYLNTPQTLIFDKSSLLYALPEARELARQRNSVVIVEGYMDAVTAHQHGESNVVASMGTAITETQVDQLQRLSRNIVFALDADAAGQMATLRSLEAAPLALETTSVIVPDPRTLTRIERKLNTELFIAELPAGSDPDSLIRSDLDGWKSAIENATSYMSFLIDKIVTEEVRDSPTKKRAAVDRILPVLQLVSDAIEQDHYLNLLSQRTRLSYGQLRGMLRQVALRPTSQPAPQGQTTAGHRPTVEDYLVAITLKHRLIVDDLLPQIPLDEITDPRNRAILDQMLAHRGDSQADVAALLHDDDHMLDHGLELLKLFDDKPATLPQLIRNDVEATIRRLEKDHHERMVEYLRSDIASAQSAGNNADASMLAGRLANELDRHKQFYPRPSLYFPDIREKPDSIIPEPV